MPELFELPVEGMENVTKWVMYDANGRYVVGDFNGKVFSIEQHFTRYENGGGYFYASQTFNDSPDGRRIQIGWGRNITNPGMPFNQPELFPTELKLKKSISGGYRLCPTPIDEINTLAKSSVVEENVVVTTTTPLTINANSDSPLHIIAEIERGDGPITLDILGYKLNFDNEWTFSTNSPDGANTQTVVPAGPFPAPTASTPVIYIPEGNTLKIEAIVDKNLLEFFVNDGELYYVTAFNGAKTSEIVASVTSSSSIRGAERKFLIKKLDVRELNSIWAK
jgi:sucrose-6-phosphate hydrolase SacC (GH32 family)